MAQCGTASLASQQSGDTDTYADGKGGGPGMEPSVIVTSL